MALRKWAYIYLTPGIATELKSEARSESCVFLSVGLDFKNKARAVDVAKQLAQDGAQLIELCGGFGPEWIAKISSAIGPEIPVGGVFYGPEFRKALVEIAAQP